MNIYILTLFPRIFESVFSQSIVKRSQDKKLLKINVINVRDFAKDRYKTVDDKPYGGGAGMILKVDVLVSALKSIKTKPYTILLSANGKKYSHQKALALSKKKDLAIICGHYEGVDHRINNYIDETLSTGDYVLSGGEIPAMTIVDSLSRLLPGSINPISPLNESFTSGILEYPQYTRPKSFNGYDVPPVLLKGDHKKIDQWRKKESDRITKKNRPDLLKIKKV